MTEPERSEVYGVPMWPCCVHCRQDKLGCDTKNPGHAMACEKRGCQT